MPNDKRLCHWTFDLKIISIENMLRKLYLSVLIVLCSVSAYALNINVLQNVEGEGLAELAPPDTVRHKVFHSKFGNDVEFPKLTDNAKENAVILSRFFSTICMKKDTKIETFIALIPLVPKSGDEVSVETLDQMLPISYRCFYSACVINIRMYIVLSLTPLSLLLGILTISEISILTFRESSQGKSRLLLLRDWLLPLRLSSPICALVAVGKGSSQN